MINGNTRLLCLLGSPVEHSFSPTMHNASFQKLGINSCYMAFDVKPDTLEQAITGLRTLGFVGANVTFPNKEHVLSYLDFIDPMAKKIGAVNTIVNNQGKLEGYNTDAIGFIESFKRFQFDFKNKKIALLGTGGAAKAVAVGLLFNHVSKIDIFSRTIDKASGFCKGINDETLSAKTYADLDETYPYDIVINSTPLGMHPKEGQSVIKSDQVGYIDTVFYDLIYNPSETEFLKLARLSGRKTMNGLDMLIYQGIYALRHWFDFDESLWTKEDVVKILEASQII